MFRSGRIDPLLARIASSSRHSLSLLDEMDQLLMEHTTLLEQRVRILSEVLETIRTIREGEPA